MKYVGSKNRLSKHLVPIIQEQIESHSPKGYLEPFVGGANLIDKIDHPVKAGSDIHPELIALLKYVQNQDNILPTEISEEEYIKVRDSKENYPQWYVGLVGFCATFGAKYFGGYARGFKADKITPRNLSNEAIRNLEKQRPKLADIEFLNEDFTYFSDFKDYVIYCDIPYNTTLKYTTQDFPYEKFYQWCIEMSKYNTLLISEYSMPPQFKEIWSKEVKVGIDKKKHSDRVEKLFIVSE